MKSVRKTENFLYIYVLDRDFGFAPNPFHGYCTLATCKPKIRQGAQIGDWVIGVGGGRIRATGRCVYLMKVTEILTFDTYWTDVRFQIKKPVRNGSLVMMVGDNIYHQDAGSDNWIQEDSHHSNPDGSPNISNLRTDTSSKKVLISDSFYYFGNTAPQIDLDSIGYKNGRGFRKLPISDEHVRTLIQGIETKYGKHRCQIMSDPFNFKSAIKRVDQNTGRIR